MVGTRAVTRTPVAMVGRRTADRVMTRRVKVMALGALAVALVGGVLLLYVLRTDALDTAPVHADTSAAAPATLEPAAFVEPAPSLAPNPAEGMRLAAQGRKLMERGSLKPAIAALTEAARLLPNDAEVAHLYGAALWRFGAQDRALFQLRRALLIARDNPVFREDLARALQNAGRSAEALHVIREGEGIGVSNLPPDTPLAMGLAAEPAGDGVNMGGAGHGEYKGRTSFTDADLHSARRVETPPPPPPAAALPSPESQQ